MDGTRLTVSEIAARLSVADASVLPRLVRTHSPDARAGVQRAVASARRRLDAYHRESARIERLYERERSLLDDGARAVAGIDEVGRGALAGPLTAAAVILPDHPRIDGLDDSKRLTPEMRTLLDVRIRETAVAVSVAHITAEDIDARGLASALRDAVCAALEGLPVEPDHVLVDGSVTFGVHASETAIVSGDSTCAAIAAASIVAKVARDSLMSGLDATCPGYGFSVHKGYGTPEHLDALRLHGPSRFHRRSFSPCSQDSLF